MSSHSDVVFDPAAAHPEVAWLRSALAARDWPACRAMLDAAAPETRTRLTVVAGEEPDLADFLRTVLAGDPDDSAAAAVLGSHLTTVGWKVRSSAQAKFVSREQFAGFHDWLTKAERVLVDAAARNPADPAVWVARLLTARGLELGQAEARRRYDRLAAIDPHHLPGQQHLLQQLCPKWGGSWDEVHTFAREAMDSSPPGSHNAVLVALAHIERWMALDSGADRTYLRTPRVRDEIYQAAGHSVWHPGFPRTLGWVRVVSEFALLFSELGDQRAVASLFAMTGVLASESPWHYLGDPAEVLRERRYYATGSRGVR
ncbi:hypothetical protein [Couchioplanes azureus]|uniref:hypothetical protein n=1 Tax=Couchioplanes caeruleus TaxID=56438 RepID=UPI001E29980B|nr:hypothetical protein [Couchioplanes caeruleus]